jgi:hypothetical protein
MNIIVVTSSILLLTACGNDGKFSEKKPVAVKVPDNPNDNPAPLVKLIKCSSSNTYTSLKKDDKVIALDSNTKVRIRHSEDGTKKACVDQGNAKVN